MRPDPTRPSILVTGGARRLGAAIARRFGEQGWHVVLHYNRSVQSARELADELPSAELFQCNLEDSNAACRMVDVLAKRLTDWRVLISNASLFEEDSVTRMDAATNARAMQVNAVTPALMAQRFLASAQSAAGRRFIQLTDQKLANPNPDFFSYTMSKHAVDAAAQMLAMACEGSDKVYRLAPGAILASHDQTPDEAETSHRMNLLYRRTRSDEIADAALFMAEGPLTSGSEMFVDSGQHLLNQPRDVLFLAREEES